jgi:Periplasmic copper-binding protein (NosD)
MWRFAFFCLAFCLFPIEVAARPEGAVREVVINQEWLAQRGQAPYVLDQPDTTYVLKTDVCTDGTAFVVLASNVVFDLNQHTIVYGDGKPVAVANGGFEAGSGRSVPGWDLSRAPAAESAPNTSYLFGRRLLRLKSFRATQQVVSDPIAVPTTDHTYVASITPSGDDYRTNLTLTVVDNMTGKVLGKGRSANVERGLSAVVPFQPGTSRAVRLLVEATPTAGRAANLDLDYALVAASYDYGIVASNAWIGDIPGWGNLPATLRSSRRSRNMSNATLKNGFVRQGGARGYSCSPLFLKQWNNLVVEGVQTFTSGMDTITLNAEAASGSVVIRDCTFRHDVDNVSNRGMQCAVVRLVNVNGSAQVERNRFLDVPLVGVLLDDGRQTRIVRNEFRQREVALNGYAIIVSASKDFEIAQNRIVAENGRGILLDGYRKRPLEDGNIHDNYVEVRERFNREYQTRIEARALKMRAGKDGPHRNLHIHHNTFVAVTGPGLAQQALAVRIGYLNRNGQMDRANIVLEHNIMRAITTSDEPNSRASALALDGLDPGVDLRIRDNILESNDASVTLADTEGPAAGVRLIANTFRKSAEGARRPYAAVHAGYWIFPVQDVEIVAPRLESGATLAVRWAGQGIKDLSIGYLLTVAVGREGKPVPDAAVSVRDKQGAEVFSGKTDATGEIRDIAVMSTRYRQETKEPRRISTDHRGPFTVSITSGGVSVSRKIAIEANTSLRVDLASADR